MKQSKSKKGDPFEEYARSVSGNYAPRASDYRNIVQSAGNDVTESASPRPELEQIDTVDGIVDYLVFGDRFEGIDDVLNAVSDIKLQVEGMSHGKSPSVEALLAALGQISRYTPDIANKSANLILAQAGGIESQDREELETALRSAFPSDT